MNISGLKISFPFQRRKIESLATKIVHDIEDFFAILILFLVSELV